MSGRDDKAQRYIALLDTARTNGSWSEVPELVRKVTKHAPQRKCLISTATLEHDIVQAPESSSQHLNPQNNSVTLSTADLTNLEQEVSSAEKDSDDKIQGQACSLWAKWVLGNKSDVAEAQVVVPSDENNTQRSSWTRICIVKSVYIKGMVLSQEGRVEEANELFKSIIPWLNSNRATISTTPQLPYWTQQLTAQLALNLSRKQSNSKQQDDDDAELQAFRQWAMLSPKTRDSTPVNYGHTGPQTRQISVWKAYYDYLSKQLASCDPATVTRGQATELRRVETSYENELLRTTQFPKATESNTTIEDWVEQVMHNWQILSGPSWSEADLGEGGRNSLGRNVIDILYRAAMKTFHSTLILRRLFQVHKALAEFELAYKALDTYLELIERGRERSMKFKEPQGGQDDDETVLRTISEAIEGLCSFGRHSEAEKAYNLCLKMEIIMEEIGHISKRQSTDQGKRQNPNERRQGTNQNLSAETKTTVYRALGIGKAHWSKWTPFNERRSSLQSEAVAHLIGAINQPVGKQQKLKSTYAVGLLLAETREIDKAIEQVKNGLAHDSVITKDSNHSLEVELIPVWHLLALLLTSRQDFNNADQSCIAAFEQFSSPSVLFGSGPGRSAVGHKLTEKIPSTGLVDDMECGNLQKIIEVRITELALIELIEGPEHAVNSSNDLLALYFRLFGHLTIAEDEKQPRKFSDVPKSSASTAKSLRGSIFGRRKMGPPSDAYSERTNGMMSIATESTRPVTQTTQAPTIQVTDEDDKRTEHKHGVLRRSAERLRHGKSHGSHGHNNVKSHSELKKATSSEKVANRTISTASSQRQSFETTNEQPQTSPNSADRPVRPQLETIKSGEEIPAIVPLTETHSSSAEAKQPLKEIPHNLDAPHRIPPPARHDEQPPEQDVRLPTIHPLTSSTSPPPRFPRASAQKHALTVLSKIWLVVARLYRRASMFEDSREACDEAAKASLKIESLIASTVESSARAFADPGWGSGGKSSDQVWADVYCERAELLLAIAKAREEKHDEIDHDGIRDAVEQFELCLMYFADHPGGIVGLSNVLLDYYERKVDLGRRVDDGRPKEKGDRKNEDEQISPIQNRRPGLRTSDTAISSNDIATTPNRPHVHEHNPSVVAANATTSTSGSSSAEEDLKKTPENLNRLAARDRAYGLLSTLTKLGTGWDNSEAWFALARAHELGGEIEKAKEILWWCVELEDTRPIRHWSSLGCSGYVL